MSSSRYGNRVCFHEEIDPVIQSLFTAASYNAGPSRIDRFRREASQKGLDPNPWFRDVEILPARDGQETVQYVSSIYEYDLADRGSFRPTTTSNGRELIPPRQFFPSGNGRPVWQKVLCLAFIFLLNLASGGSASEAETSKEDPEAIPEVDFKKLPKSILWDFTHGLFSADNLVPVLVGAGVAGVSTTFEDELTDRVRGEFEFLGDSGNVIGHPITATAGVVTALLASRFTDNRRFRAFSYTMAQSYVLENVMTQTIKAAVSRTRPNGANDNSFASGHTAATFSFATVAGHYFGKKVAIPAFAAGVWVGAARIESGKHFLSDVIIGAVVGIIAGRTAIRGTRTQFSEPHVQVVPQILGDSVGVTLHVRW